MTIILLYNFDCWSWPDFLIRIYMHVSRLIECIIMLLLQRSSAEHSRGQPVCANVRICIRLAWEELIRVWILWLGLKCWSCWLNLLSWNQCSVNDVKCTSSDGLCVCCGGGGGEVCVWGEGGGGGGGGGARLCVCVCVECLYLTVVNRNVLTTVAWAGPGGYSHWKYKYYYCYHSGAV